MKHKMLQQHRERDDGEDGQRQHDGAAFVEKFEHGRVRARMGKPETPGNASTFARGGCHACSALCRLVAERRAFGSSHLVRHPEMD